MKFLDKDTVLRLLKQDEINHSVVISDPNIIDCPMVYVSEEFVSQIYLECGAQDNLIFYQTLYFLLSKKSKLLEEFQLSYLI